MDALARYNQERWSELASLGVDYAKPFDDFDRHKALDYLDRWADIRRLGLTDFSGRRVLCLAGGGGQQSVCFGLLGADVTVFDLTPAQLASDQRMAAQYGYSVRVEHGDMRDLTRFGDGAFDLVYQPYAINFVPDPLPVIGEAARVLRSGGRYYLQFANPLWRMEPEDWTGSGYPITHPYRQGVEHPVEEQIWDVQDSDGRPRKVAGPREFTHTLGTLVNSLGDNRLAIFAMVEVPHGDATAEPGSWEHMLTYLPVWPAFWSRKAEGQSTTV